MSADRVLYAPSTGRSVVVPDSVSDDLIALVLELGVVVEGQQSEKYKAARRSDMSDVPTPYDKPRKLWQLLIFPSARVAYQYGHAAGAAEPRPVSDKMVETAWRAYERVPPETAVMGHWVGIARKKMRAALEAAEAAR